MGIIFIKATNYHRTWRKEEITFLKTSITHIKLDQKMHQNVIYTILLLNKNPN